MPGATLAAFADRLSLSSRTATNNSFPKTPRAALTELLAGLTVALALVPEAVAFAFVAGVHPLVGLYAAFIVGLITALFGGRPGMISGATGALAVVMVALVSQHGVEYLFATVVLMGIIQIAAGVFRLGKFIRLVPHPVMLGFVNGLAIVIFMAQLTQFQMPGPDGAKEWMTGFPLVLMLALVALTMAVIWGLPKLTKAIPAPLAGILVVAALVLAFDMPVPRVGDLASIEGGLPAFHVPMVPLTLETLRIIMPYALILAAIGLIESLLTLNLVGEMTEQRGGASKEYPQAWYDEDTILGDYLRVAEEIRKGDAQSLNLLPMTEQHESLPTTTANLLAQVPAGSQTEILEQATLLGVELLRGGKPHWVEKS